MQCRNYCKIVCKRVYFICGTNFCDPVLHSGIYIYRYNIRPKISFIKAVGGSRLSLSMRIFSSSERAWWPRGVQDVCTFTRLSGETSSMLHPQSCGFWPDVSKIERTRPTGSSIASIDIPAFHRPFPRDVNCEKHR